MSTKKTCGMCGEVFADGLEKCPLCGGSGTDDLLSEETRTDVPLGEAVDIPMNETVDVPASPAGAVAVYLGTRTTEQLEAELRDRSAAIGHNQTRFQRIHAELKRRREVKDEQPAPREVTADQQRQDELDDLRRQVGALSNKVIAMEGEQAKLVVEAELFKAQRVEAEDKLALVARRLPAKREPMSRDAARDLARRHMGELFGMNDAKIDEISDWVIDAIVEASR